MLRTESPQEVDIRGEGKQYLHRCQLAMFKTDGQATKVDPALTRNLF